MSPEERLVAAFKPGLWRHYKGGLYSALMLVTHHETRAPWVLYVSHTYGGTNIRPLWGGAPGEPDGWFTHLTIDGARIARFTFVGYLPSDTKMTER